MERFLLKQRRHITSREFRGGSRHWDGIQWLWTSITSEQASYLYTHQTVLERWVDRFNAVTFKIVTSIILIKLDRHFFYRSFFVAQLVSETKVRVFPRNTQFGRIRCLHWWVSEIQICSPVAWRVERQIVNRILNHRVFSETRLP